MHPPQKVIRHDKINKFQILILLFRIGERHEIPKEWKMIGVSLTKSIYYVRSHSRRLESRIFI